MDQRQLDKERIRLTREIAMLESQLDAAVRGKEEKLEENKQIREEIAQLEEENKGLEEETQRLDDEIAKLDEEFKQAQIDAGRLRREIKVNGERTERELKQAAELRTSIAKLEKNLELLRREIRGEVDERRNLEVRLRKTTSQIEAMKTSKLASFVTKKLEKQDWYKRMEEPMPSDFQEVSEIEAGGIAVPAWEVKPVTPAEAKAIPPDGKKDDEGGIDFSVS